MFRYNPEIHHNKSIRLKGYDYSSEGAYFVTICTKNKECFFGNIVNGNMILNEIGLIVKNEWENTAILRDNVFLDAFVIMPNHIHGIIVINNDSGRCVLQYAPTEKQQINTKFQSPSKNLGAIVRGFKSTTTKQINKLRNVTDSSLWQRNYYEHIIRNEKALNNISKYIIENPLNWKFDKEN